MSVWDLQRPRGRSIYISLGGEGSPLMGLLSKIESSRKQ